MGMKKATQKVVTFSECKEVNEALHIQKRELARPVSGAILQTRYSKQYYPPSLRNLFLLVLVWRLCRRHGFKKLVSSGVPITADIVFSLKF